MSRSKTWRLPPVPRPSSQVAYTNWLPSGDRAGSLIADPDTASGTSAVRIGRVHEQELRAVAVVRSDDRAGRDRTASKRSPDLAAAGASALAPPAGSMSRITSARSGSPPIATMVLPVRGPLDRLQVVAGRVEGPARPTAVGIGDPDARLAVESTNMNDRPSGAKTGASSRASPLTGPGWPVSRSTARISPSPLLTSTVPLFAGPKGGGDGAGRSRPAARRRRPPGR